MNRPLAPLYASGEVRRWHQNPAMARHAQTLADHQGRCVQILLQLHPEASPHLIRATAYHDVGEAVVGDLSRDFKRANPALAAAHANLEAGAREAICGPDPWLTGSEHRWLKLVDGVEAAAYALMADPVEARRNGWPAMRAGLYALAADLGCEVAVARLFTDLEAGAW